MSFPNSVAFPCIRCNLELKLQHYASANNSLLRVSFRIDAQEVAQQNSIGLCQCEKDDWRSLQDGFWSSFMSPYERKYVDVKFGDKVTGSVTVGVDEG
ncbi:hypothetical protein Tco_0425281 [Tanacetum coccineum]